MDKRRNQAMLRPRSHLVRFRRHPPLVCGFFKSGRTCRAGERCPLAHKLPRNSNAQPWTYLSDPNPDPKTVELLFKAAYMGPLDPPRDQTIKTLYIRLLNSNVREEHLRDRFSPYGEIESIVYFSMRGMSCAYLTYTTREAAEKAMLYLSSWVEINGQNLKLLWGTHRVPKYAVPVGGGSDDDGGGGVAAWGKQDKEDDGGEVIGWSKRGFGSSEQWTDGCGFDDGIRGCGGKWDVGGGHSNWVKVNAVGGSGECFNWGMGNEVGDGFAWGKPNKDGGEVVSWTKRGFGSFEQLIGGCCSHSNGVK